MRLSEFYGGQEISPAEKELLAFFLRTIRSDHATGQNGRRVSYQEMLSTLRDIAFEIEKRASRKCDPDLLKQSESVDAAANVILAVHLNLPDIQPLLVGLGKKMQAARWKA